MTKAEIISEDWLLANLPQGWTYDCTFEPEAAFLIYASEDIPEREGTSAPRYGPFVLPLRLLANPGPVPGSGNRVGGIPVPLIEDEDERFVCEGHEPGPYEAMGVETFCDGTCKPRYVIRSDFKDPEDGWLYWSNEDGWGFFATATRFTLAERNENILPMEASGWVEVRK